MNKQRPLNLNLFTIRFPIPAIVSILHRVSGVFLFLLIPLVIWMLQISLASQESFDNLRNILSSPVVKAAIWLFLAAFLYHLIAGVRHLLMDIGIGIELKSSRLTAIMVFSITFLCIICAGVYLW